MRNVFVFVTFLALFLPQTTWSQLSVSIVSNNGGVQCNGDCNGNISSTVTGGTLPYTYVWYSSPSNTPIGQTNDNADLVCAGDYYVVVTDAVAATATSNTYTLIDPPVLGVNTSATPENCFNACDGTVGASAFGGSPPYQYTWSNGLPQGQAHSGLCSGTYNAFVTDDHGCFEASSAVVMQPSQIIISPFANNAYCFGDCTGEIFSSNATGGVPPYTYSWDNGIGLGQNHSNVCAGTYTLTVTDATGCTAVQAVTVLEPTLMVGITSSTGQSCGGGCDGTATVNGFGGTAPYSYQWDAATGSQVTSTATNLCPGNYGVVITDANGCVDNQVVNVNASSAVVANYSPPADQCFIGNSFSFVDASTNPIAWSWDFGDGVTSTLQNPTHVFSSPGTYTVTLTVSNGACNDFTSHPVTVFDNPTASVVVDANMSCFGVCDGQLTGVGSGGATPYTYLWDVTGGNVATATTTNLCAVTPAITIIDANGCTAMASATIIEPAQIVVATTATTNPTCNGGCDGSATVSVLGAISPYTVQWDDPLAQVGLNAINLCAGTYIAYVTDANGCTAQTSVTLTDPNAITTSISSFSDVSCFGNCDGSASVQASGGSGGYVFFWPHSGNTTATHTGLCPGTYAVDVTDLNGCTAQETVVIDEPAQLAISFTETDASCNGVCDGWLDKF